MPTTKQKKLREQREIAKRRRLHGRSQRSYDVIGEPIVTWDGNQKIILPGQITTNPPSMQNLVVDVAPSRSKCPACGFSQKVRKDGTIGSHGATPGSSSQCAGTGQPWTSAATV